VQARSILESTAPKARSRSREGMAMNEAPRMCPRGTSKLPSLVSSSLSLVIAALASTSACPSATVTFLRASTSLLSTSKHDAGRRAERLEVFGFVSESRDYDPVTKE